MRNNEDPRDSTTGADLGQAGSMFVSALAELLTRAIEISGRRSGRALAQSFTPAQDPGAPASWIDGLLTSYRDYLGEMASSLPMVARRLSKEANRAEGDRVLFDAELTDKAVQAFYQLRAGQGLATTEIVCGQLEEKAKDEGIAKGQLPHLLRDVHRLLDKDDVRDLPSLLDRLKYDFRKHGKAALADIRQALSWLHDSKLHAHYALLASLSQALGERGARKVLRNYWLQQYAAALDEQKKVKDKEKRVYFIPDDLIKWLHKQFSEVGIQLSYELSVLANWREAIILDHHSDTVYDLRHPAPPRPLKPSVKPEVPLLEKRLTVFGPHEGRQYEAAGNQLLLPARVFKATQGFAVWSLDKRIIQEELDNQQSELAMRAWDIGSGKTPVALFAVDYKEGDLGAYLELGLGCFAAPRKDPLAVGMFALTDIPVTTPLSCDAGTKIWGFPKVLMKNLRVRYRELLVEYTLSDPENVPLMTVTLPRGGEGSSNQIPLFAYTIKNKAWHRTLVTRSGRGEMLRGGGNRVSISITANGRSSKLCDALLRFDIARANSTELRTPLFTVWTEHMTAELSPPSYVTLREDTVM
jgi:hypothetical protein